MIKVNEYLEGKIKSLGFEVDATQYTTGVMLPGEYSFDTEKEEHITLTVGELQLRHPGEGWKLVKSGETIVVPSNSTFNLVVAKPASYICMYK